MSPIYNRRRRATSFMSQPVERAFDEYDSLDFEERFDLLGLLEPDQRAVFLAALAQREAEHENAIGLGRIDLALGDEVTCG